MRMTLQTRTVAVHALRTTTAHQITAMCADYSGGRCAVGVIAEAFGCNVTDMAADPYCFVQRLGIRHHQISARNDGYNGHQPHTFAQIADYLETQPITDPVPDTIPWNTLVEIEVAV